MRRSAEFSVEAPPGKMKSIFFSLSLLLLLEKQAVGIGIYGGTNGHFLVKTSPLIFIQKGQFLYGHKEAQEEAPEETIFVQSKHHAYGQDADADLGQAQSSQEQTDLSEDIVCDEEDEIAQQKSQLQSQSQIKSQTQVKSHGAQLKSQTGQLKTIGQVKSQIKMKSHGTPLKAYLAPLNLRGGDVPRQIKGKGYGLDEDLAQARQQHTKVHRLKRKLGQSRKTAEFLPQFRQSSKTYDGYIIQFQEQLQGSIHHRKSVHQVHGPCYCTKGGLILYQDAFTG